MSGGLFGFNISDSAALSTAQATPTSVIFATKQFGSGNYAGGITNNQPIAGTPTSTPTSVASGSAPNTGGMQSDGFGGSVPNQTAILAQLLTGLNGGQAQAPIGAPRSIAATPKQPENSPTSLAMIGFGVCAVIALYVYMR